MTPSLPRPSELVFTCSTRARVKFVVSRCPATCSGSSPWMEIPCRTPSDVPVLWLGTAERISAIVEMDHPGVWLMGDLADDDRELA